MTARPISDNAHALWMMRRELDLEAGHELAVTGWRCDPTGLFGRWRWEAEGIVTPPETKAERLRALAIAAYWAAQTPTEAKMAGILLDLFAPDIAE